VRHGFSRQGAWSKEEAHALLEAIATVPDSILHSLKGLRFARATASKKNAQVGGDYNTDTHTVTMYDRAFGDAKLAAEGSVSQTRFGAPGSPPGLVSDAVRAIAHEIGHAADLRPLRASSQRLIAAHAGLRTFAEFETAPGSGQYHFPSRESARAFDRLQEAIRGAKRDDERARSLSGSFWKTVADGVTEITIGQGLRDSAFRQAVAADGGVRITKYSDEDWQEAFAEDFSLWVVDPRTLAHLRPQTFAFFEKTFR
jgi:hypothetical protein